MGSTPVRDATSLLEIIRREALDPAYAQARDGRGAPTDPETARAHHRRPKTVYVVTVALPLILLGVLIATAAAQARRSAPDQARERAALVERIETESTTVDAVHAEVEQLRAQVSAARDTQLRITSDGRAAAEELAELELASGAVPVTGPGLQIIVDDATPVDDAVPTDSSVASAAVNRVLDIDLQQLTNGLWSAGAEAIAINGARLTTTTAIRSAGDAIVVAFRPLRRPYTIEAIGDPQELEARFVDGPGGRWFRTLEDNYRIRFDVSGVSALRLPAASGVALIHASPVDPASGTEEGQP